MLFNYVLLSLLHQIEKESPESCIFLNHCLYPHFSCIRLKKKAPRGDGNISNPRYGKRRVRRLKKKAPRGDGNIAALFPAAPTPRLKKKAPRGDGNFFFSRILDTVSA